MAIAEPALVAHKNGEITSANSVLVLISEYLKSVKCQVGELARKFKLAGTTKI